MADPQVRNAPAAEAERLERILEQEGRELLLQRMRKGILLGAPLYLAFGLLDYLVASESWLSLVVVRLVVVAIGLALLIPPLLGLGAHRVRSLSLIATYTAALGITVMTFMLGGFSSDYYIGNLLMMFLVGLFFPWGFRLTTLFSVSVIITYVVGNAYLYDARGVDASLPVFFLAGTAALTCWAADAIEQSRRREIALRFQLEAANENLKELDEAKTSFFANVSHELRTPLMLILGPLESMIHGEADDPQSLLRAMDSNAHRLLRQVNMILNFSKLEAGQQEVSRELGSVGRLLGTLVAGAAPYAQGRGITLQGEGLEDLPPIPFDQEKIETAAANLLSNAMKFTPDGGRITVRAGTAEGGIWFEVEDTGCGIPESEQGRIFERFHQVAGGKGGKIQGTGLGLALSKELVDMHGGRVSLHSVPGEGTTFRVELPDADALGWSADESVAEETAMVAAPSRNDATSTQFADLAAPGLVDLGDAAPAAAPDNAPVLLVVEDNPDMRAFIAGALRRRYRVHTAVDGLNGIEVARRVQPDLIVSDVMMPRMDGFEMVRALRKEVAFDRTPIIMLTARTGSEAVVRGLNLGAVDYVSKPFKMPELLARISAQLRMRAVEAQLIERDSRLVAVGQMTGAIAHDLRGPLTGIYNRIELLRMIGERVGNLPAIGEDLDAIEATIKRINGMIQELLDFVGGTRASLHLSPVRMGTWLEEVARDMAPTMAATAVALEIAYETNGKVQCALDRDRMRRVIENLVNNAREAMLDAGTEQPLVRIVLSANDAEVTVRVVDNGPGIPPEVAGTLFQPFATAGKSHGTGLGLAVARNLVVAHNGEIDADSAPGAGATFTIRLPRLRSNAHVRAA